MINFEPVPVGISTSYSKEKRAEKQPTIALICTFSDEKAAELARNVANHRNCNAIFSFLGYLIPFSHGCEVVAPSLETIAKKCKLSVRHISRVIKILKDMGILQWSRRPYNSNVYKFSSVIDNKSFRQVLAPHMKLFAYLCITLLMPFTKITAAQYHQRELKVKMERFHTQGDSYYQTDITGSSPGNISNIESYSKVTNQSLYTSPQSPSQSPSRSELPRVTDPYLSQSKQEVRAREEEPVRTVTKLSKVANRIGMLLNLGPEDREQFGQYNDEELLYAEELFRKFGDDARDKVRWVHSVCRNYKVKKQDPNFNKGKRTYSGQYNRSQTSSSSNQSQIQATPLKSTYTNIQQCSQDDPGSVFYARTGVWVREVEITKREPVEFPEAPTYESLKEAFDNRPGKSPMFMMLRNKILERAQQNKPLDFSLFAEESTWVPDSTPDKKGPISDNTVLRDPKTMTREEKYEELVKLLRGGAQR